MYFCERVYSRRDFLFVILVKHKYAIDPFKNHDVFSHKMSIEKIFLLVISGKATPNVQINYCHKSFSQQYLWDGQMGLITL